jgi:transcriptional regulator with XRE-family HTH domain
MQLGENIKRLREEKGLTQQQLADLLSMHRSNYSKVENGQRELSIAALNKVARYFNISLDALVNGDTHLPEEVTLTDKTTLEQLKLIGELEVEDKATIFKLIDTFLTKKKFKDFFQKNIAAL